MHLMMSVCAGAEAERSAWRRRRWQARVAHGRGEGGRGEGRGEGRGGWGRKGGGAAAGLLVEDGHRGGAQTGAVALEVVKVHEHRLADVRSQHGHLVVGGGSGASSALGRLEASS